MNQQPRPSYLLLAKRLITNNVYNASGRRCSSSRQPALDRVQSFHSFGECSSNCWQPKFLDMNTQIYRKCEMLWLLATCLLLLPQSANAWQDDPFGSFGADDPHDPAAAFGTSLDFDQSLDDSKKLLVDSLRDANPSTPVGLARAIRTMLDIEQYQEARRYLNQLIALNPDQQQMFELSEKLGPDFFLRLRDQGELQPEAAQFAEQLFTKANQQAFSVDRVRRLTSELSDDNKFVRQDALRKIRLLGAPAAAMMLNVCDEPNRRKEIPYIRSALKQMDDEALLPLVGAARADGTVAQAVAVGALSSSRAKLAQDTLLRTSISSRVPQSVQAMAADAVAQRDLFSPNEVKLAISRRANMYLEGRVRLPVDGQGNTEIWNWNFEQKRLLSTVTSSENASRYLAIDLARDVYQLEPGNFQYRQLQLLTVLEGTKRVIGPSRFVLQEEVTQFVPDFHAADLDDLLRESIRRELWPAATAAAEVAGQFGDISVLQSSDANPRPLVQAITTGYRPLQFAAARSIAMLDPKQSFPGCSYVAQVMVLMANSDGRPTAIVLHPQTEISQDLASSVFQTGMIGLTANSAKELFEMLKSNPDISLVFVTDTSGNPNYQELVQQIRGYWLTKHLPIGLLALDDKRGRKAGLVLGTDPKTLILPLNPNPKFVLGQVQRLNELRVGVPVTGGQLEQHAGIELEWLRKTLADPETYQFYHLSCYRDRIAQLGAVAGAFETKSDILKNVGTPAAQRTLLDLANDASLTNVERQSMAESFNQTVRKHGLLLTMSEVKMQYDRYNASESSPKEIQDILGFILDSIELKTRGRASQLPGDSR